MIFIKSEQIDNLPFINETDRLRALEELSLLDTVPEEMFDDITNIASTICETPIALISLVDKERQYFKSHYGLEVDQTSIEDSFCAHAIVNPNIPFEVKDARKDPLFSNNTLVTNKPNIVFYYGIPLVTEEGYPLGTLCVIDNKPKELSESQKNALKSLSNQVMHLLDLRKKNRLLETYQLQLENYSKNMESFASLAAHDLKEPLRNINSFTKLIEGKNNANWDDNDHKYFYFIDYSIKRMNQLILDLLNYAKGSMVNSDTEEVNVNELIQSIFNSLTVNIEFNKPTLIVDDIPNLIVSKTALGIIFQNIIGNALKYKNENKIPKIKVKFEKKTLYSIFSIEDNGIGIEEKYLETIFEPFKRLHLQKDFEGSGLGLASCRKIVEKHQGKIWATSEINKGTTIHFSIKNK